MVLVYGSDTCGNGDGEYPGLYGDDDGEAGGVVLVFRGWRFVVWGDRGSQADPAVRHTYVNVGHYDLSLYVEWSGQFTFSGYGITQTVNLGTVDGPLSGVSYGVQEVRGVGVVRLVGVDGDGSVALAGGGDVDSGL